VILVTSRLPCRHRSLCGFLLALTLEAVMNGLDAIFLALLAPLGFLLLVTWVRIEWLQK
jgi:hypothetical protein